MHMITGAKRVYGAESQVQYNVVIDMDYRSASTYFVVHSSFETEIDVPYTCYIMRKKRHEQFCDKYLRVKIFGECEFVD